jgi:hypothetical protein
LFYHALAYLPETILLCSFSKPPPFILCSIKGCFDHLPTFRGISLVQFHIISRYVYVAAYLCMCFVVLQFLHTVLLSIFLWLLLFFL